MITYCFIFSLWPVQFPGWMVNSEGSVFIATANDNAVGMYTCTAYNSYGTMGKSEPTQVILQVRWVSLLISGFSWKENIFCECWVICGQAITRLFPRQDPPSFQVPPRVEYLQEVGRELIIPCEAIGDPSPNITWSKVQEKICFCRLGSSIKVTYFSTLKLVLSLFPGRLAPLLALHTLC